MNRKQWRRVNEAQAETAKANAKLAILRVILINGDWYTGQCSEYVARQIRLAQIILGDETT